MEATTEVTAKARIRPNIANMVKGPNGSYHKGDVIGNVLAGLSVDQVLFIATECGVDISKYDNLNNGQKRMTVGGILRKLTKTVEGDALTDKQLESNQDAADCLAQITKLADGFRADNETAKAAKTAAKAEAKAAKTAAVEGDTTDSEGGTLD
jgi:hypothetical protein